MVPRILKKDLNFDHGQKLCKKNYNFFFVFVLEIFCAKIKGKVHWKLY